MIGDRVEVLVDVGDAVRNFEIAATKAGRKVEITVARGTVEVAEVTRTGQPVRSARFMASRVIAIVEHPSEDGAEEPRSRRRRPANQPALELDGD